MKSILQIALSTGGTP